MECTQIHFSITNIVIKEKWRNLILLYQANNILTAHQIQHPRSVSRERNVSYSEPHPYADA